MLYRKLGNTEVSIPVIGQGTWKYGEDKQKEKEEVEALRFGIRNGLTLIDTAEEYGNEGAEKIVGQACKKRKYIHTVNGLRLRLNIIL
ncbi:aldo/keto reductase [Paenibacillus sp. FSL K6-0108]|uniref:aldo/keto reductase n=1 Tax=Paenibacillus sp. FSL K6-0108 TaxID=2921417 RepID=UPI003253F2F0